MAMEQWRIERLAKSHDRTAFSCGQPMLDDWLKRIAGQCDRRDLARTYVALRESEATVIGYYALSNHALAYDSLPSEQSKGLPRVDIPVILLGRLAVDGSMQGKGLGEFLLLDALRRCQQIAEQTGVRAVEVDAIDAAAKGFYLKHGFLKLLDDEHHLLLPMQVIRKLRLP